VILIQSKDLNFTFLNQDKMLKKQLEGKKKLNVRGKEKIILMEIKNNFNEK